MTQRENQRFSATSYPEDVAFWDLPFCRRLGPFRPPRHPFFPHSTSPLWSLSLKFTKPIPVILEYRIDDFLHLWAVDRINEVEVQVHVVFKRIVIQFNPFPRWYRGSFRKEMVGNPICRWRRRGRKVNPNLFPVFYHCPENPRIKCRSRVHANWV